MTTATKKKLSVTPLRGRLLVEEDRPMDKVGRIHIPDQYKKTPSVGVVVAIGESADTQLVVGNRIVYNMYAGTAIAVKGMDKRYRTLSPEECLCLLNDEVEIEETGA